ncbi:hypothetical protein D3C73_1442840 [compost metagenome]
MHIAAQWLPFTQGHLDKAFGQIWGRQRSDRDITESHVIEPIFIVIKLGFADHSLDLGQPLLPILVATERGLHLDNHQSIVKVEQHIGLDITAILQRC